HSTVGEPRSFRCPLTSPSRHPIGARAENAHWFRIFWTEAHCPFPPHSRRFRRTAAILLVRAADGMDAQQAAEYLGFPPGTDLLTDPAQQSVPAGSRERMDKVRESLHRVAEHLAAIPPADHVDYRHRRRQHDSWHLGDDAFAELVKHFVAVNKRKPTAPASQLHEALSALIWSQVTGSEPCLAPCFRPPFAAPGRSTARTDPAILLANRLRRDAPRSPYSVLLPALAHHVDKLLTACPR
ncbi:hypothetical protein AB0442_39850, partial [Kitasatospora sp. NPDC085895]